MLLSVVAVPGVAGATFSDESTVSSISEAGTQGSVESPIEANTDADVTTATSDHLEARVSVGRSPFLGGASSYRSDATVNISASVVDTSGTASDPIPDAVAGVGMTVTVTGPDGNQSTFTRQSADGVVTIPFELAGRPDGLYTVEVSSSNTSVTSDSTRFAAGPQISIHPSEIDAKIEVGRTTQISVVATEGGYPADVTRNVTISQGFFDEGTTRTVTTGPDGVATFDFTASESAEYQVGLESSNRVERLTAVDAFADVDTSPPSAYTQVFGGDTVTFSGRLVDDAAPLANEDITVRVVNSTFGSAGTQMTNLSATTDAFGQFVVEWQTPDKPGTTYKAQIYDSDDDRIRYDGGDVFIAREDPQGPGPGPGPGGPVLDLGAEFENLQGYVEPGTTVDVAFSPTVDGDGQANTEVSYALTYGSRGAVLESGTVTTDASGQASFQATVPESAPDGGTLSLRAVATLDGNRTEDYASAEIQDFRSNEQFRQRFFAGVFAGGTVSYRGVFEDIATTGGVSGVPYTTVVEINDRYHSTTVDAQSTSSNASGVAAVSTGIPGTASGDLWIRSTYPYWDGVTNGAGVQGYNVSLSGLPGTANVGDTASLSYTTDSGASTSGILLVGPTGYRSVDDDVDPVIAAQRVDPGEPVSVTFPDVASNVSYVAQVVSIDANGVTARSSGKRVFVRGNGTDVSAPEFSVDQFVAPSSATVGSNATLTATVSNVGDANGTTTVDLRFDGQVVASRSVSLAPGESTVVAAPVSVTQEGTYDASVETADDQASTTIDFVVERFVCGTATGDPHLGTFDGTAYDFQAAGEFVLARGTGSDPVEVQGRFVPISDRITVTEAVATEVGGTEIMIDANHSTHLWIDGSPTPLASGASMNVNDAEIRRQGGTYTVVLPGADGTANATDERVSATVWGDRIDVEVCLREDRSTPVEGVFGDVDGDRSDDFALDNGTALGNPPAFDVLYGSYRASWQVNTSTSLFHYDSGESVASFNDTTVPRSALTLSDLDPDRRAEAERLAEEAGLEPGTAAFRNAVIDYALTNETDYFASARASADTVNRDVAQPTFAVSDLSPMDVRVTQGETINVSATVENTGSVNATQTVEFRAGGNTLASESVSLDPGENTTVEFTDVDTGSLSAGNQTHGVYTADGSQTATLTVQASVSGVDDNVTAAVAGTDGAVDRQDVLDMVTGYLTGGSVDGVSITREDVLALVQYYLVS